MAVDLVQSKPYRDYPIELKASAIAHYEANGRNYTMTARELGIPENTLKYWTDNADRFREFQVQKRADITQKLDYTANLLVDAITPEKIENASLSQIATAAGIMIDKSQLLKGLPTNITENIERQELTLVLNDALADVIDVTPE